MNNQLSRYFEMKDLGEARKILGMEIMQNRVKDVLWLTQSQYLKKLFSLFDLSEKSKTVTIPLATHMNLSASLSHTTKEEIENIARVPYANEVGSLMYAMVCKL